MDITTKNAKFQEKSMIFLDYLLRLEKAHDISNTGLDSFITCLEKFKKSLFLTIFALINQFTITMYLT